jgi:YD repeat-containing protein
MRTTAISSFDGQPRQPREEVHLRPGPGYLTEAEDANGQKTRYRYDAFGRLEKIARPGFDPDVDPDVTVTYSFPILPSFPEPDADYVVETPAHMQVDEKLEETRSRTRLGVSRRLRPPQGKPRGSRGRQVDGQRFTPYDALGRAQTVFDPFPADSSAFADLPPGTRFTTYGYQDGKVALATHS